MIDFLSPGWLTLFVIVLAMAALGVWLARWRRQARVRFAGPQAARWPSRVALVQTALLFVAASLIVLAAARPAWGTREFAREREGVDLVIALDISLSMNATDAQPTRLKLSQDALIRLVEAQRGNRVGIVFFAGTAILRSPLTTDTEAVNALIRRADREGGLTRAGSDIGAALDQAANILAASESPGKAVLVVSDGEDHVQSYVEKVAGLRDKGIAVFAAGAGTPQGAALTETDPRFGQQRPKVDAQGRPVISRLDEASLRAISTAANGRYLHLTSTDGLLSLRDDFASLQQTAFGAQTQRISIDRFQWFAGAAFVLLALSWLVPGSIAVTLRARIRSLRLRPGLALVLVAILVGACGSSRDALRDANADANALFAAGDFETALEAYETLLADRPDVPELAYNAGNALHRLGSYERAIAETQRALPPSTSSLGAATYYAIGNHLLASGDLESAYAAYRSALLVDSGDGDAKHNLEVVLRWLVEREQQPGQQPTDGAQSPQPGEQGAEPMEPQPGEAPPQPGEQEPQPGQGPDQPTPAQVQRDLQEALSGIDDTLTFEEAIRILELLQRQQQQQQRPAGSAGTPAGPDY